MTERTLLLRSATAGRHCVLATDFPSARIFDTQTSSLAATVELPPRHRSALASLRLTAVALATCTTAGTVRVRASAAKTTGPLAESDLEVTYAAVGLSDGTLLAHNVTTNTALGHVAVSNTQRPLLSLAILDHYVWCLAADGVLHALDLRRLADGVVLRHPLASGTSGAVLSVVRATSSRKDTAAGATATTPTAAADAEGFDSFLVLSAGLTLTLLSVRLPRAATTTATTAAEGRRPIVETVVAFASQGSPVDYAWLRPASAGASAGVVAVTGSAEEGVVRVWDMSPTATGARCRRTLLCGQRFANLSVLESPRAARVSVTTFTGTAMLWELGHALLPAAVEPAPLAPTSALVSVVPKGRLLQTNFLPDAHTAAADAEGEAGPALLLLRGRFAFPRFEVLSLRAASRLPPPADAAAARAALGLGGASAVGLFALPFAAAGDATDEDDARAPHADLGAASGDSAAVSFRAMDTVWAAHQHRAAVAARAARTPSAAFVAARAAQAKRTQDLPVLQQTLEERLRHATAMATAAATGGDEGAADEAAVPSSTLGLATVPLYQALHANDTAAVMELLDVAGRSREGMRATVQTLQLPYCLTLLRVLSERLGVCSYRTVRAAAAAKRKEDNSSNDNGEKDTEAATAATSVVATTVGGGLGSVSTRSPLLEWVDAIVHYRGVEMYAAQREANEANEAKHQQEQQQQQQEDAGLAEATSAPTDFLAPLLHQYRATCGQYDKLASLYGRMSVFRAVRPSEKNTFVNTTRKVMSSNMEIDFGAAALDRRKAASDGGTLDDIVFPAMFTERRTRRGGTRAIRVRSRLDVQQRARRRRTTDAALLERATELAKAKAKKGKKGGGGGLLEDSDEDAIDEMMIQQGEDLDMDALDQMALGDDDDSDDSGSDAEGTDGGDDSDDLDLSEEDEDEDEDEAGGRRSSAAKKKRRRHETDAMIADEAAGALLSGDDDDEDDSDEHLDSSEAEFSDASDDEVHSAVLDFSDAEEGSSDSSDEEEDEEDEDDEDDDDDDEYARGDSGEDEGGSESSDDGMGDQMKELLEDQSDAKDRAAIRKTKRVRTDY